MTRRSFLALGIAIIGLTGMSHAADKPDPTGTWKWKMMGRNGQDREVTLKLKLEGEKLTGTISGRNNDTNIEEATFKDGEVAFSVTREMNGQKFTTTYKGKVDGDAIKGKVKRGNQTEERDWEAKREKA